MFEFIRQDSSVIVYANDPRRATFTHNRVGVIVNRLKTGYDELERLDYGFDLDGWHGEC